MADRTEWPNELRLRRLREQGRVPISNFACRAAGCLFFLLALWLNRAEFEQLSLNSAKLISAPDPLSADAAWSGLGQSFSILFVVPLAAAFVGVFLVGLLQTKFLFRLDLAAFRGERVTRFRLPSAGALLARPLVSLGQGLLFLLAGLLILRVSWTGMFYLLNHGRIYAGSWWLGVMQMVLVPLCAVLAITAVLAWFVAKFVFFYQHRMTRAEAEQEVVEREVGI